MPHPVLTINSLLIAAWNANRHLNHKSELIQFLHDTNTDIMLISETHFTNKTLFKIPKYTVYHCNHPDGSAHGGAAVIIRVTLRHCETPPYRTENIQAAVLNIDVQPWSFNIAALYSPPRHNLRTDEYDNFLHHLGTKFIVGGDWNAKHTN